MIRVYDYREDLQNLVIRPEGRARFRRVALGPVPPVHSHDLGVETFLVLDGEIEFTVEDEAVVCRPGQLISVPPRTRHAVRAVGERPGAIYLSVAPHIEPTHTFYDEHGTCLPPRYGAWREGGGAEPPRGQAAEHVQSYCSALARLVELAQVNLTAVNARASAPLDKEGVDTLWAELRPVLEQVQRVESVWNDLVAAHV